MTARSALHSVRTFSGARKASGAAGGGPASWPCSSSQDWYRFSPAVMSYSAA